VGSEQELCDYISTKHNTLLVMESSKWLLMSEKRVRGQGMSHRKKSVTTVAPLNQIVKLEHKVT
jgi:hypothetical protein